MFLKNFFDCVIFVAHPDDAFLGMGGTIARLSKMKQKILLICFSDGANDNEQMGDVRKNELELSSNILGINYEVLNFKDGELKYCGYDLFLKTSEILEEYNPLSVYTHHYEDTHSDHVAVYESVKAGIEKMWHSLKDQNNLRSFLQFSPIRLTLNNFLTLNFNSYVNITNEISIKKEAIMLHRSQYPSIRSNLKKQISLNHFLGSLCGSQALEGFYAEHYKTDNEGFLYD